MHKRHNIMADLDIIQGLKNISDREKLSFELSFIALFIAIYEYMIDDIEQNVKSFFCRGFEVDEDGKVIWNLSDEYKEKIKNRRIDERGNKDELKATMLWLKEQGAITEDDYKLFLAIKLKRNDLSHEMIRNIWDGLNDADATLLSSMIELNAKIDKWWINEIEIPTTGQFRPDEYDPNEVLSGTQLMFSMMINTLYGEASDKYKKR